MNRNSESRFTQVPHANINRSMFDLSHSHLTTINQGDIVPILTDQLYAGDTIKINLSQVIRMATPLYPVMDNAYLDVYAFATPNRILWEHWVNLMGENTSSPWAEETEYSVPQITAPTESRSITSRTVDSDGNITTSTKTVTGWANGTLADYMGIPTDVGNISVSALPFRAYAKIYNEWFRDENLVDFQLVSEGDETTAGANTVTDNTAAETGATPLKAAKYHGYFTSSLPSPLKGTAPTIPITGTITTPSYFSSEMGTSGSEGTAVGGLGTTGDATNPTLRLMGNYSPWGRIGIQIGKQTIDLGTANSTFTVEDLRNAIAIQHWMEASARRGTRYRELLLGHFGVSTPDSRMQIPEYIGGYRIPIQINQVVQTSATGEISPQGNVAAYSMTTGTKGLCTYSATEPVILMVLAVIRVDQTYQQGIERWWQRKDRFDFYWPEFANLGEMAVLNQEIYAQGTDEDTEVFGYQEAWADLRYKNNRVSCEMRSNYGQSLDAWHYAQFYGSLPTLSSSWIAEGNEIDRTIAVQSEVSHQFIADFYFDYKATRPMPVYSIPGLERI